jgi:SPP1 gp7 family putative phage head morphogenesis protein
VWAAANLALADEMRPILYMLMVETGEDAIVQAGKQAGEFNPLDPAVVNSARAQAQKAAVAINSETDKQLRASLSQGIDAGESTEQLTARAEAIMGNTLTMRTARIAETESTRAMGNADVLAWVQAGTVTGKEWYTAKDERVCPWCGQLDGVIIALDADYYQLGDTVEAQSRTLNIAYEDVGSPPLHNQCRCVVLDVSLA